MLGKARQGRADNNEGCHDTAIFPWLDTNLVKTRLPFLPRRQEATETQEEAMQRKSASAPAVAARPARSAFR